MSNIFMDRLGLVGSAVTASVTVYGVYKLGKTAYTINNTKEHSPTSNEDFDLCLKYAQYQHDSYEAEGEYPQQTTPHAHTTQYRYYAEKTISDKIIFIPKQFTEHAIYRNKIAERFESTQQLFYYLRRRSNMEAIHGDLRIFQFNHNYRKKNGREMLIFCTDLHSQTTFEPLYIIGRRNDKTASNNYKKRIEKWKMSEFFLTQNEILHKYGIATCDLPSGSSLRLDSFNIHMNTSCILNIKNNVSMDKYCALKCIKTKLNSMHNDKAHIISKEKLIESIEMANILRPIISFSEDKSTYYIDMVLLVEIGNNNWIGVIFRDYNKHKYIPIDLAVDCYDLRNKMTLFNPPNNETEYMEMNTYSNSINGLNIVDDSEDDEYINTQYLERKLFEATQRIQELKDRVKQQEDIIEQQSEDMDTLKEVNNYYFQQCLNPQSSIKPHCVHLKALRAPPITISIYQQYINQ